MYLFSAVLPNRTMLWHGSRMTNYCGILSQGLRIAPVRLHVECDYCCPYVIQPEAPVTGYMFGRVRVVGGRGKQCVGDVVYQGVYFANSSSKSANYCFTRPDNNVGLLLLCEVGTCDGGCRTSNTRALMNDPAGGARRASGEDGS
jgi:hypothetical protein